MTIGTKGLFARALGISSGGIAGLFARGLGLGGGSVQPGYGSQKRRRSMAAMIALFLHRER